MLTAILVILCFCALFLFVIMAAVSNISVFIKEHGAKTLGLEQKKVELLQSVVTDKEWERILKENGR